jgi:hypothetical protein
MNHPGRHSASLIGFLLVLLLTVPLVARAQQVGPQEFIPNDPRVDAAQARTINLLAAYADILKIEQTSQPKMQQAVIAMLEDWVDCNHPEFQATCLSQLIFNATDRPYESSELHGISAAGTGMAETNNAKGVASTGGFGGRIRFIPIKVCDGNLCRGEWVQAGLAKVLEYKRSGVPIVVVGCNFIGGVSDPVGMDQILRALDAEQVDIIAPADNLPINMDEGLRFPLNYTRLYPNIIGITAADETGKGLAPFAGYGPTTVSLLAPGVNVRTVSTLDPVGGAASMSGSSAVTQQISAAYALVRVYREPNSAKAREILKFTARMYPALEGKLKSAPGDSSDAGRMSGVIDVHDALTLPFGCPASSSELMLVTKRDSDQLIAVDSVLMRKGPFRVVSSENFLTPDRQTRILVFAYNLETQPSAALSTLTVQMTDSTGRSLILPVESEKKLTAPLSCLSQLTVNLNPQSPQLPPSPGEAVLRLQLGNSVSSPTRVSIIPSN